MTRRQEEGSATHWADGTTKSQGNAFTAHGYVPGRPAQPTQAKVQAGSRSKNAFGYPLGTIPGSARDR